MAEFDDFGLLAQMARRQLIHLLELMPEVKDLAVEQCLMRPLDKIASMSVLQEHNCAHVQQFSRDVKKLLWGEESLRRVYIIRPTLAATRIIAEQVLAEPERNYSVIFVPQRLYVCELEFERQGVFGMIECLELELPLISIDSHLFSLEHHEFTAATLVDHTFVHLRAVAKSLWQLQSLYGLIPIVYGVGEISAHVNKMMKRLYTELGEPRSSPDQPISHLFLMDRNLDLATVFLTGLTYESMLHDTFEISCGKVTFGTEVSKRMRDENKKNHPKITNLDNNDPIFSSVRNMHMTAVFPFLSAKAKSLQASYSKGSNLEQVKDMKEFVANELRTLKQQHKLLELHICACEAVLEKCKGISDRLTLEHALISGNFDPNEVMAYLEDCMCAQRDQWQVLILACLWSLTQNGIPSKYFTQFRVQYLHAFGYENLPALHFLGIQGLLIERPSPQLPAVHTVIPTKTHNVSSSFSKPTFQYLSRRMTLLPGNTEPTLDLRNPDQMRYVFSGCFTPILCKIVGDTVSSGWNMEEMKSTFGDSVFCDQNSYTRASRPPDSRIRKAILVYFIGGVTYAEVAALTLLAQHNDLRIVIAATNIIHREKFIKEMANVAVVHS